MILNKTDYLTKMNSILNDSSKFQNIGPVNNNDNTAKLEGKLQKWLLKPHKDGYLTELEYNEIRSTGLQRPRLYGLPKTRKPDVPLRPILPMIGSSQHQLAKYFSALFQPMLEIYSNNCIKGFFLFAEEIRRLKLKLDESFLCSFDISSLFTNVPLAETIQNCADTLYEDDRIVPPTLPKDIFVQLMTAATACVEFSFNNIMFRQIDGVAMGSPLGPTLANIFVGNYENKLFASNSKIFLYQRYVDDIFSIFTTETQCDQIFVVLNSLHPSHRFTVEKEKDGVLPFLDVKIEKSSNEFLTSVYRKLTFTGLYTNWNSFEPTKRKTNLVGILVHRALKICSKSKLQEELNQIRSILQQNGNPEIVTNSSIRNKISRFNLEPKGPQRCLVYLPQTSLDWKNFPQL